MIKALTQTGVEGETRDGMDICLCVWDKKKSTVEFAGANNPLYHITNGELVETRGDKQPIGYYGAETKPFTCHSFKVKPGDSLYLFSDGFADQFGGKKGKKYKYKRFKELLIGIAGESAEKQKKIIDKEFTNWRGDLEQLDDICVIGLKF